MSNEEHSEYSTPRNDGQEPGGIRRYTNGKPRMPNHKERMQDIRTAGLRDQPLPIYTRPGIKLQD
jgi:hypothetical protein